MYRFRTMGVYVEAERLFDGTSCLSLTVGELIVVMDELDAATRDGAVTRRKRSRRERSAHCG